MDEREELHQPETVSKPLTNYLDMTTPRSRVPVRRARRRDEYERGARPAIDNRGLSLEEGNDFA
jgi:hypothetical protein